MQQGIAREFLLERRLPALDTSALWEKLSLGQKFAVDGLMQLNYELLFIRQRDNESLVVLKNNDSLATINEQGEIDISPQIITRS